ncbi:hypothetical protein GCK32_003616, partial [Trichostrongylus colubriformis]
MTLPSMGEAKSIRDLTLSALTQVWNDTCASAALLTRKTNESNEALEEKLNECFAAEFTLRTKNARVPHRREPELGGDRRCRQNHATSPLSALSVYYNGVVAQRHGSTDFFPVFSRQA